MVRAVPILLCLLLAILPARADLTADYANLADAEGLETDFYTRVLGAEVSEPAREAELRPTQQRDNSLSLSGSRFLVTALLVILGAGLIVLLVQNAGLLNVDRQEYRRREAEKQTAKAGPSSQEISDRTATYAARADRIEAVEDMLAEALNKAERDLDLIFGEADTARELERRLSGLWQHHGGLRVLVGASEQSQFAGIPLSADQYATCVTTYRQIMGGSV